MIYFAGDSSVRLDRLQRYVDAGKIPAPSFVLEPRFPRWDRLLDETLRRALLEQLEPPEAYEPRLIRFWAAQIEWLKRELTG